MTVAAPQYFMLRLTRLGPLVPARLWWCDHEPGVPDNKLDRGHRSIFPCCDIAGTEEIDPQVIFDRLYSATDMRSAIAVSHWKYAAPTTEAEYRHQLAILAWAEQHSPSDPRLTPKRRVDARQIALPDFSREREATR